MKQLSQIRVEGRLTTAIPSYDGNQIVLFVENQIVLYTPANGQLRPTGFAYNPYFALPDNTWLCSSWSEDRRIAHLQPDGTMQLHDDVVAIMNARPFPQKPSDAIIVESERVSYEFNTGYEVLTVKHPMTKDIMAEISPTAGYSINKDGRMLLVGMFDWGIQPVASRYDLYRAPDWLLQSVPCENPLNVTFCGNNIIMAASRDGTITLFDPVVS